MILKKGIINEINSISDSKLLHNIAKNYNWDDGFEIPYSIINNNNCDLGTALMIFYDVDGYRLLENKEQVKNSNLKQWVKFIFKIEEKIINNEFKHNNIKFTLPLTKVQFYKLKKKNPNIAKVFLE